jgi:hypothetical protein
MKKYIQITYLIIISILFVSCAKVPPPKLAPNHLIDGVYIDIHSPNQEGWVKFSHSNSGISFGKYGNKYNESSIAQVVFYPMKNIQNNQEFLELIKYKTLTSSDKNRYIHLKSNVNLSKKRKYTCVLASALYKDKLATTRKGNKEELFMQVKSLYCRDPKRTEQKAGFMIGYSYRGEELNSNFDSEANSFIRGVEFPEYK